MDATGNMYIFLPADAIDTKRRINVAMKAGVYKQLSKCLQTTYPSQWKSSQWERRVVKVTRHIFPSRDHLSCQDRANRILALAWRSVTISSINTCLMQSAFLCIYSLGLSSITLVLSWLNISWISYHRVQDHDMKSPWISCHVFIWSGCPARIWLW